MLLLITTTIINAQSPTLMHHFCENSSLYNISTSFKTNLNKVLSWVTSDSATTREGYNRTVISSNNNGTNDAVYGLYSCRVDITGYFCKFCLTTAASEIARRCAHSVNAIIWYDICIIRYSNERFWGKVSLSPTWNITGDRIIKDKAEIMKAESSVESLITKATIEKKQFWAVESSNGVTMRKGMGGGEFLVQAVPSGLVMRNSTKIQIIILTSRDFELSILEFFN
ncbi:hypothetical protein VNO78_07019 [Psophocarpus tetragonolobus]|uniref:Gnk2-homologous domain-containing protein n=1 Tax=Psophocarpus tetragonolobus TaxID=3891 RepID=A0AAN9SVT0_PSOTE